MRRAAGIRCCRTCSGRVSESSSAAPRREPCRRRAAPITPIRRTGSGRRCTPSGLTPRLLQAGGIRPVAAMGLGAHRHRQARERHGPGIAAGRVGAPGLRGAQGQDRSRRAEVAGVHQPCRGAAISRPSPPASASSPSALAEPASGSCRRPRRPRAGIGTGTSTGGERSRMRRGTKRRRPQCHTRECQ